MKTPSHERKTDSMEIDKCMKILNAGQDSLSLWRQMSENSQFAQPLWIRENWNRFGSICCRIAIFLLWYQELPPFIKFLSFQKKIIFVHITARLRVWNTFVWVENITCIWRKSKWEKKNCNFPKNMAGGWYNNDLAAIFFSWACIYLRPSC